MTIPLPEPASNWLLPDVQGDYYTATQMKEYGEAMRRAALEEIRSTVLAAGLANGGIETADDIYREIAWQVREKALEEAARVCDALAWRSEPLNFAEHCAKEIRSLK